MFLGFFLRRETLRVSSRTYFSERRRIPDVLGGKVFVAAFLHDRSMGLVYLPT